MTRFDKIITNKYEVKSISGAEYRCLCPWHNDRSGHLYINSLSGLYYCQSCGAKGTLNKGDNDIPPMGLDEVSRKIEMLQSRPHPARPKPEGWLRQFDIPTDYWTERRGLSEETVKRFRLGYDMLSDRVTIPLRDMHGNILGVTYRVLDNSTPRYQHPKRFPVGRHLFGAWLLDGHSTVAICEGQVDAISGWEARVPAVATMGARVSKDQVKVLRALGVRKVVMLYDNDGAGRRGTVSAYEAFRGSGIVFSAAWYRSYWTSPDKTTGGVRPVKDPDELTPERYRKAYHSALPVVDWIERSGISA